MKQLTLTLTMMLGLILTTVGASFADIQSTRNFYAFSDRLLTAGQPSESALKNASKDGIEVVINLVPPSESIFNPEEEKILTAQGIEYVHLPVNWREPDPADLEKFLQVMKRAGDKKVLVHCWANARASAFAYAHRVSQAPDTQSSEWDRLRNVWSTVAGYNLDKDSVWMSYLKEHAVRAR